MDCRRVIRVTIALLSVLCLTGWGGVSIGGGTVSVEGGQDYSADAGCIGYWDFDTGSETTTTASGCNTLTMTVVGDGVDLDNVDVPSNLGGESMDLAGTADYLSHTASGTDEWEVDPHSYGCFISPDGIAGADFIFNWYDTAGSRMWITSTNSTVKFNIGNSGNETAENSVVAVDTWAHVVATWDSTVSSGALNIYVDGLLSSTVDVTAAAGQQLSSANFIIGANPAGGSAVDGLVDDCFIDSRQLSAAQVCEICRFGYAGQASANRGDSACNSCSVP